MYYNSVFDFIYVVLFWWVIFLVFQRINNRYPKSNPWKKDIILTFIQAVVVTFIFPLIMMLII
ncbi:hypothetical protein [Fredinandcohnia onubensis]|uniref:hypothetical protein n=1 Tax=Fredinandcohnia onubensis TaxID=1571209 RepID=UPI000C0C0B07|nr:hypothetical protein [Fredinandcohnia onubensis]